MNAKLRRALWSLAAISVSSLASAAEPDWHSCAVPGFGDDRHRVLTACQSILEQSDLSTADRVRALIVHGRTAHKVSQFDTAISDFEAAMKLAPTDPEPVARRGSVAFGKGDYKSAAAFSERALQLDPNCATAIDTLGTIGLATGNYQLAKVAYDKEIELRPNDPFARYHRFEYFMDTGAQPEALEEIEKVLSLSAPDLERVSVDFRGREVSLHTLGRLERATMLEAMGRLPEALQALDEFVKVDPGEFSYGWRGWYYFNRDQLDLAKTDIAKALSYAPDYWILHHLQGRVYLYTREYDRAVVSLTEALALKPDVPSNSFWARAIALRALHRTEEANADAWRAASDPGFLRNLLPKLAKLGYYEPDTTGEKNKAAVRDAVSACMLDEECW